MREEPVCGGRVGGWQTVGCNQSRLRAGGAGRNSEEIWLSVWPDHGRLVMRQLARASIATITTLLLLSTTTLLAQKGLQPGPGAQKGAPPPPAQQEPAPAPPAPYTVLKVLPPKPSADPSLAA